MLKQYHAPGHGLASHENADVKFSRRKQWGPDEGCAATGSQDEWDAFAGGEAAKPAASHDWMSDFDASSNGAAASAPTSSDPFGQLSGAAPAAPAHTHSHSTVCASCTVALVQQLCTCLLAHRTDNSLVRFSKLAVTVSA